MPTPLHLAHADAAAQWLRARVAGTLRTDSRQVQPGDAFIAWPGQANDGRRFVAAALAAGAAACLVDDDAPGQLRLRRCAHRRRRAPEGAGRRRSPHLFLGRPSEQLQVVATTGTNGKTCTAWWTAQALTALGRRCGVIGTLGIGEPRVASGLARPPA